jgi:hypothetical protein
MATKLCTECFRRLPLTPEWFAKDKYAKDGVTWRCKECTQKYNERISYRAYRIICGGKPTCQCPCGCKEDNPAMLSIEHTDGNGAKYRDNGSKSGYAFAAVVVKHFDETGEVLSNEGILKVFCLNCNTGTQVVGVNKGICPRLRREQINENLKREFPEDFLDDIEKVLDTEKE